MFDRLAALPLMLLAGAASAGPLPDTYAQADASWRAHKGSGDYQAYVAAFVQYNNGFHVDERSGCYQAGSGKVNLLLVITHAGPSKYAWVERVLADSDSPKAQCFMKAYQGLSTGIPPYLPFVLQMSLD